MTKHLRLIMLSLLAMICLGGYSAVGDTYKLVTSVSDLHDGDVIVIGDCIQGYAMGSDNDNNRKGVKVEISDGVLKFANNVAELTLKACTDNKWQFHSNEGYLYAAGSETSGNYLKSDENITDESSIATIVFDKNNATITFGGNAKSKVIKHNYSKNKKTGVITSYFSCYSSVQKAIQIYKKQSVDNRQDAGIHFAKDSYTADFANSTFNGAELVKPEGINKVIYTISPESEGVSIAEDGTVTYPAVEATYKVTAKFDGNDTYKPATATYTLNVVDPNLQTRIIEFVAGVNKSNNQKDVYDELNNDIITISSDRAAFGWPKEYRFYNAYLSKKGETTISTKYGTITKIEFAHAAEKPLENLSTQVGEYKYDETTQDAVWTGNSKSVLFTAKAQARASKITVTVKVPVAKAYTLDENSVNTIEAYENANVTLKRTFYKDGEWNTLCLPFAVADAKTAFDGAELREVDTKNSNGNTIVFKEATAIEAGKPYLIKWAKTPNEVCDFVNTFEGVTLVATATPVKVNDAITFTGFYNKATADKLGASVAAIGAGNKLFKVTSGEMKGFRAAFVLNPATPAAGIKVVIDGTTTGIEDLVVDGVKANGRVYNLNGQYVGNSLNGLQPGIYIQNGKKVVVK